MYSQCLPSFLKDISFNSRQLKIDFVLGQALEQTFSPSIHTLFLEVLMRSTVFSLQRPLLFQTSEDIVNNPSLGESLPFSVVLHYLFSRAPNELKYPHEVWTCLFFLFRQPVVVDISLSICLFLEMGSLLHFTLKS